MINLLSSETQQIDIASITVSGVLSLVLIGVTIINIILNIKAMRDSSRFPIKTNLVNSILNFDSQFYNLCTKIVSWKITDKAYVAQSVNKLDDLNTELYENIIKVKCAFPINIDLIETLEKIYNESEKLYLRMDECKDILLDDIAKAWVNIEDEKIEYNYLIKDLLSDTKKYNVFVKGLNESTVKFLDAFVKVSILLESIDYQKFMKS